MEIGIPMLILFVAFSQVFYTFLFTNHINNVRILYNLLINYTELQCEVNPIFLPIMLCFLLLFCPQYLKNFHVRELPVLERFALLISITVIWAYAHLLTASGAYKHHPEQTQVNCRTDRANLISSAPWLVAIIIFP